MANNEYLEQLKKQMSEYQKNEKQSGGTGKKTKDQILAKYFVPRNQTEEFRILPPIKSNQKPIQEAFFHQVEMNVSGGKKKKGKPVYCPAHNDPMVVAKDTDGNPILDKDGKPLMKPAPCPLCAKRNAILKKQHEAVKGKKKEDVQNDPELLKLWEENREIFKDASKWEAKKYYIVRGIDTGKAKDGVKFWRFKKNFKNQGVFDKLLPALNQFMELYGRPFYDPNGGGTLMITTTESEFNGFKYTEVTAINCKPPSKLHEDEHVANQWLGDKITWRDVFKPKAAPNITPYQYLEMVAIGNDPYWDESDQNNKHWVFPGNPELEKKANERTRNLDADQNYDNFEQASDIEDDGVTISNVTNKDVGSFQNSGQPNAVDVTETITNQATQPETATTETTQPETQVEENENEVDNEYADGPEPDEYDDLPF